MIKELLPYSDEKELKLFLSCKDYTVSRETFNLFLDEKMDLLITLPRPSKKELPGYYESEDYISHTDSKATLMDSVYQMIKNYSIKKKLKMINGLNRQKGLMLDIGCGTGDFLATCEGDGWSIHGIEPNEKARQMAKRKISKGDLISQDINPFLDSHKEQFDVITMWHVLEHVPNLMEYIEQLKYLLKPDGCLVIAVPNFKSYDADHYKEHWAAYDVPRHLWHFSENAIDVLFGRFSLKVFKTLPMVFDSFYVSLLSERYKTGKSNLLNAFRIGLLSNLKAKSSRQYSSLIYLIKNED